MELTKRPHATYLVRLLRTKLDTVQNGVEVGVFRGEASQLLLYEFSELCLRLVDPWKEHTFRTKVSIKQAYKEALDRTWFAQHRCPVYRMTSLEASKLIDDGSQDFVFIDASHYYEDVKQDIELWWPKVRKGGLLIGHDYGCRMDRIGKFGVKKAVDEFCSALGQNLIAPPRHTVWSLRK